MTLFKKSDCSYSQATLLQIVFVTLLSISFPVICFGNEYPPAANAFINDYAHILKLEDSSGIYNTFEKLSLDKGITATLLTISSINDYGPKDSTIDLFSVNLFDTWKKANVLHDNGILIVMAKKDRNIRIELGSSYRNSRNEAMQQIISEVILPSFKFDGYSKGLYRGAMAVADSVMTWSTGNNHITDNNPQKVDASGGAALLSVIILSFFVMILRIYLRNRKRVCPTCHVKMNRLKEKEDDTYLQESQRKEESLRSVDYDVWLCNTCGYVKVEGYKALFSKYRKCPKCKSRTMQIKSRTIHKATINTTGEGVTEHYCSNCGFHSDQKYVIPRIEKNSDYNSSSGYTTNHNYSSGYNSSGGGASGKW